MTSTDAAAAATEVDDFIARAVQAANPNTLRVTLYQLTGDLELMDMERVRIPVRGGASYIDGLAKEYHAVVQEKAIAYLREGPRTTPETPSRERIRELMFMLSGEDLSEFDFEFAREELALDEFPRDVEWTDRPSPERLAASHVAIVGAGICGIAAAIQLQRLGIPYTVYERQDGIGGVWHVNDYPEARVDVTSFMYQYKFEKNYPWPDFYSTQAETRKYLNHVAVKHGIMDSVQLNTTVTGATWDEAASAWLIRLETPDGESTVTAQALLSASGSFSTPRTPDIPGMDAFLGPVFHTTAWDHSADLRDRNVALIGNGSTGSQLAPNVARQAAHLYAFQRTPNWISQIPGYRDVVPEEMNWLFENLPYFWNWYCFSSYISTTRTQPNQEVDEDWQSGGGQFSQRNDTLRASLTEYIRTKTEGVPGLFEKCLPSYPPMARRLVVDNGWYDMLRRDNVELVTDRIERITPTSIVTVAGEERKVDVIILAAGFQVSRFLWPAKYTGRGGVTPDALWSKDGARAYLGITMPGFPNFFMFAGPNGAPRAGGHYTFAELWTRYVTRCLVKLLERGHHTLEVKQDVYERYNAELDDASKRMIWSHAGQGGYYLNEYGRSGFIMPWRISAFYERLVAPHEDDFTER